MSMQDKLIPLENQFENIDMETFMQNVPIPQFEIAPPKIQEPKLRPNPIQETNKILEDQNEKIDDLSDKLEQANSEISKQTKELQSIHYENMKLNAQIDVLNKTIDSQNDELEHLRNINAELKITNDTLSDNSLSAKDWKLSIVSFISGVIVAVIGGIILHFFIE